MYSYQVAKLLSKLHKNKREYMSNYFRKKGIKVGDNCNILSDICTKEPFLVSIGDNVTISSSVLFTTHDASVAKVFGPEVGSDVFGRIEIGDNCFIGMGAILLCGVSLTNNIIVAAGSVVTKSFNEERIIIGGNPAKKIGDWDSYREKNKEYILPVRWMSTEKRKLILKDNPEKIIKK